MLQPCAPFARGVRARDEVRVDLHGREVAVVLSVTGVSGAGKSACLDAPPPVRDREAVQQLTAGVTEQIGDRQG